MASGTWWTLWERVARYLLFATVALLAIGAGGDADVLPTGAIRWLTLVLVLAFGGLAFVRYVADSEPEGSDRLPAVGGALDGRLVLLSLLGLVAAGAVLRGYALGAQSLWFDEAISANAAIALKQHGRPTFPSGYTYWRAFPHTAVVAASMALFGTGEAAARLPSVVFGVATIVATYWLGREVGGSTVGLVAATLVTFATWEIAWSRQARMYQLFQLLFTLSLVALLRVEHTWSAVGWTRGADGRAVASLVVVVALAALTHPIGLVLLPVAVAYLGLVAATDGRLSPTMAGGLTLGSLALLLVVELAGGEVSAALASVVSTDVDYLGAYVGWTAGTFGAVFHLGLIGSALAFYLGRYRAGALLVLAVVPATWVLSFHTELFATRYLYFGVPVLFVWAALAASYVAFEAADWLGRAHRWWRESASGESRLDADGGRASSTSVLPVALGLVVLLSLGGGFTVAPQAEYELGVNAPQPDFEAAYAYVNEHREPGDVIVAGWTAPGLYYAGGVDYWLAHDLAGTGGRYTVDGVERYAGAEPLRSVEDLCAVIQAHERGWLVVDAIVANRWRSEGRPLSALRPYVDRATVVDGTGESIRVYVWEHGGPRGGRSDRSGSIAACSPDDGVTA